MSTNPITNVDYFFKSTLYFALLHFELPDAPDVKVPCLLYTDRQAFNEALTLIERSPINDTDPYSIDLVYEGHQVLFSLVYLNPDKKTNFLQCCMELWLQLEVHDIRYRGIGRLLEIRTISDFYHKVLLMFGITL